MNEKNTYDFLNFFCHQISLLVTHTHTHTHTLVDYFLKVSNFPNVFSTIFKFNLVILFNDDDDDYSECTYIVSRVCDWITFLIILETKFFFHFSFPILRVGNIEFEWMAPFSFHNWNEIIKKQKKNCQTKKPKTKKQISFCHHQVLFCFFIISLQYFLHNLTMLKKSLCVFYSLMTSCLFFSYFIFKNDFCCCCCCCSTRVAGTKSTNFTYIYSVQPSSSLSLNIFSFLFFFFCLSHVDDNDVWWTKWW